VVVVAAVVVATAGLVELVVVVAIQQVPLP